MKILKSIIIGLGALLLVSCANNYTIEVDLTDEERAVILEQIEASKESIANYDGSEGYFPYLDIIDLARSYEALGEIGKAIDLYEDYVNQGAVGQAIYNNLGRLYEKTENYERAIAMYQRIVDELYDTDYLYDITWAYIRAGDRKSAEKYFNAWQLELNKTDEQTQQALKKMREAENAN